MPHSTILTFEKNSRAYELSILRFSKLHSKSSTVLAVKRVPVENCIVNIYRNATFRLVCSIWYYFVFGVELVMTRLMIANPATLSKLKSFF